MDRGIVSYKKIPQEIRSNITENIKVSYSIENNKACNRDKLKEVTLSTSL